ncbi:hypothetical protein Tco_0168067 [Tanacetum coccineum]
MDKSVKSSSYWPRRIREDRVQEEKAQEKLQFNTNFTLRRNTTCHITDCHAGNPCVHICDPTTLNHLAMIGNLEGHDSMEWAARLEASLQAINSLHPSYTFTI